MGPNYSISTACATSNFCILNAANHIIRGEAVSFLRSFFIEQKKRRSSLGFSYSIFNNVATFCSIFLIFVENVQDMMLCGGSDAVIIPIGIFSPSSAFIFILFSTKAINFI